MARSKKSKVLTVNGVVVSQQEYNKHQEKLRKQREAAKEKREIAASHKKKEAEARCA